MACVYNEEIFQKFRELAVTDPSKIEVGKTYFSNSWPERFTVKRVATELEFTKEYSYYDPSSKYDNAIPRWFHYVNEYGETFNSLQDRNCGASYSPWLIFEDKETAERCREELQVTIVSDYLDDYFDDPFCDWPDEV